MPKKQVGNLIKRIQNRSVRLFGMRREYELGDLDRQKLNPDPFKQFSLWFEEAVEKELLEPNAMILSTVSAENQPRSRTVLLKQFDQKGFVFYTNYESNKAAEIAGNPQVSLLFPWFGLERQLIVSGPAKKISSAESLKYFASRPLASRLGAWASPQSKVISNRALLEKQFEDIKRKFANGEVPLPSFWGGYRVSPETFEFWQGRKNRLHDRFQYQRDVQGQWVIQRLAP